MEKIEASITSAGGHTGRRMAKDKLFKYLMTFGGLSVIIAISTIFFYLASVVAPLFMPPHMDKLKPLVVTATDQTSVHLAMEEQVEIGARFASQGGVTFFSLADGKLLHQEQVGLPKSVTASSFSAGDLRKRVMAYGLANGRLVLFKDDYKVTFTQDPENPQKD
ncbi:MAG: phosphate ABC transporter permease, partial [Gallionellaceae bacterium CG_4_10_14_3_um_filter_60_1069]